MQKTSSLSPSGMHNTQPHLVNVPVALKHTGAQTMHARQVGTVQRCTFHDNCPLALHGAMSHTYTKLRAAHIVPTYDICQSLAGPTLKQALLYQVTL